MVAAYTPFDWLHHGRTKSTVDRVGSVKLNPRATPPQNNVNTELQGLGICPRRVASASGDVHCRFFLLDLFPMAGHEPPTFLFRARSQGHFYDATVKITNKARRPDQ